MAVQTKVGSAAGVFRYTYTDHLGNIVALSQGNSYVGGSLARYDPFGNYRTTPDESVNPDISNHGFTGHRMNNTGEFPIEKVGLIYMNARYYLPEIGRFISPDTIVPDPGNPQNNNRYSYVNNDPVNNTDPTGHWLESALDIAFIAYDLYDIQQNGLNLTNGLSLVADVGGLVLPVVTGGGLAVRALTHADDVSDGLRMAGHLGDGAQAIVTASQLSKVGSHTDEAAKLVKALAEQSTHGSGSRVVIGQAIEGAGYVAEAKKNGGIYFETAEGVWDALGKNTDLVWSVNEQFLRTQLENGNMIQLMGETVEEVLVGRGTSFTAREINFLNKHAHEYGYQFVKETNAWVKMNP